MSDLPFSIREGFVSLPKFQSKGLDETTRIGLYNVVFSEFLGSSLTEELLDDYNFVSEEPLSSFAKSVWSDFLNLPLDEWNGHWPTLIKQLKELMTHYRSEFFLSFNFIEFLIKNYKSISDNQKDFEKKINNVLKKNNSAYRLINGIFGKLSTEEEVKEVDKASRSVLKIVNNHIQKALKLMSQKDPDYVNSIAESVKAVEAICEKIAGNPSQFRRCIKHN